MPAFKAAVLALAIMAASAVPATATAVFDTGVSTDDTRNHIAKAAFKITGGVFTLTASTIFSGVNWAGVCSVDDHASASKPENEDFTLFFFNCDPAGDPGAVGAEIWSAPASTTTVVDDIGLVLQVHPRDDARRRLIRLRGFDPRVHRLEHGFEGS